MHRISRKIRITILAGLMALPLLACGNPVQPIVDTQVKTTNAPAPAPAPAPTVTPVYHGTAVCYGAGC